MRAIITEVNKRYAIALGANGDFIKIRNNGKYRVGYEYEINIADVRMTAAAMIEAVMTAISGKREYRRGGRMRIAAAAAMCVFIVSLGLGVYGYVTPYSYVNLDINPSVEISINIYDRVIKVKGLNDDGWKIIGAGSFINRDITETVDELLDNAVAEGYIIDTKSDNTVVLTVFGNNSKKVERIKEEIEKDANKELNDSKVKADLFVDNTSVQRRDAAMGMGISPGKLNLIDRLVDLDPTQKQDELKDKSVKDIMKSIKKIRKDMKLQDRDDKDKSKGKGKGNDKDKDNNKDKDNGKSKEEGKAKDSKGGIRGGPDDEDDDTW